LCSREKTLWEKQSWLSILWSRSYFDSVFEFPLKSYQLFEIVSRRLFALLKKFRNPIGGVGYLVGKLAAS
jgi:hypothetical protein